MTVVLVAGFAVLVVLALGYVVATVIDDIRRGPQ